MQLRQEINPTSTLYNKSTGKSFNLVQVITDYLLYIRKSIETIVGNLDTCKNEIRWCFTIPAIWTDQEKALTKEAAMYAGFIDDLDVSEEEFLFAPEPEAAAAYCMDILRRNQSLAVGETFLVCDAGGGTIDLTSHVLYREGQVDKLKSLTIGGGGPWGASELDKRFIQVMEETFGEEFIRNMSPFVHNAFCELWEQTKLSIVDLDSVHYITPNADVKDYFESNLDKASNAAAFYKRSRIILDSQILHKIYDEVLDNVCSLIQEQISLYRQQDQTKEFHNIFLVGGFCESQVLQNRVKKEFTTSFCRVTVPDNPGGAIAKGAVLLGLDPSLIMTRKMRRGYGVASYKKFDPLIHKQEKKVQLSGGTYSKDVLDLFVDYGDEVKYDSSITREYKVSDEKQETMVIELISTCQEKAIYTDDYCATKCGEIVIDMKGTSGLDREVQVSMKFGKSVLEVSASDNSTGKKYKASLDFSKNEFDSETNSMSRDSNQYHFIFVNDTSGSMSSSDVEPNTIKFMKQHNNRLGVLYEACEMFLFARNSSSDISSCVMYHSQADILFEQENLSIDLVDRMSLVEANGGTSFINAMKQVQNLVLRSIQKYPDHRVIVLFMSDGEDDEYEGAVTLTQSLVDQFNIVLHTIQLGNSNPASLKALAAAGQGEFKSASDAIALSGIYKSLANHPIAK